MSYRPTISRDPSSLRTGTLGTSYDANPTPLDFRGWNQAILLFNLSLDGTSCEIKIEVASPADTDATPASGDWHQITYLDTSAASASSGTETVPVRALIIQLVETMKYAFPLPVNYKWVRVSAKRTGGSAASTLTIRASQGLV